MRDLQRLVLPLAALALVTPVLNAQTSVYVVSGLAQYGFNNRNGQSDFRYKDNTADVGGGAFYNFPLQSRLTLGIDGRVQYSPGYKGGTLSGVALRIGFVPHRSPLRPYVQIGAGFVHSPYHQYIEISDNSETFVMTQTDTVTSGAAQFLFGLDIRLSDHFDLRVPEFGSEAGAGNSGVHAASNFLHAGLVYHPHPLRR